MKKRNPTVRRNVALAQSIWGELTEFALSRLRDLTETHALSVESGDLQLLNGRWYVTHGGLLRIAERRRCYGIKTVIQKELCDPAIGRWVFSATVYKASRSNGFVGYGDADPSNVSALVRGAEMRIAETRAVNRALRKAYGIGVCSVEELGTARSSGPATSNHCEPSSNGTNGRHNGQPRLRDRLCLLIRQHRLDATLVKAFAADYCGTPVLRDASREAVEAFINDLAQRATTDRDGLLSHLNTYAKTTEVSQ